MNKSLLFIVGVLCSLVSADGFALDTTDHICRLTEKRGHQIASQVVSIIGDRLGYGAAEAILKLDPTGNRFVRLALSNSALGKGKSDVFIGVGTAPSFCRLEANAFLGGRGKFTTEFVYYDDSGGSPCFNDTPQPSGYVVVIACRPKP